MTRTIILSMLLHLLPVARAEDAATLKALQEFNAYIERDRGQAGKPIIAIYVHKTGVDDELATRLKLFPKLERIGLNGTTITDETLKAIKDLKHIHTMNLHGTGVTNAGLRE